MLETIISWLASVVGELLDIFVNMFIRGLHIDLGSFVNSFPMLLTGYKIFQSIGIGLIICIASFQLFKFFAGQLSEIRDTPIQILLRAGIAGLMLWFGGNIIEMCIDIAVIPFNTISGTNASDMGSFVAFGESIRSNFGDMIGTEVTIGPAALLVLSLILMGLIGWNVLKLILEVCERYLMIGVLAFSAPLVYPTITSKSTANVFWKFIGMFLGQCAIMTLSIWFLKLILSGFSFTPDADTNIFFRFLLTLAMCKIAQRVDTYMQQLGIGVATTGGNLMDEAIGAVYMLSHMGGKSGAKLLGGAAGGGGAAILGAGADGSLSRFGGLFGGLSNMAQRAVQQIKSGDNVGNVVGALGKNFSTGAGLSGAGQNIAENAKNMAGAFKDGDLKSGFEAMGKTAQAGLSGAAGLAMSGAPANAVHAAAEAREMSAVMGEMGGTDRNFSRMAAGAGGPATAAFMNGAAGGGSEAVRRAAMNHAPFNQNLSRYSPQYLNPEGNATMRDNTANLSGANQAVLDKFKDTHQTASQFMASQRATYGVGGFEYSNNANGGFGDIRMDEHAQAAGSRLVSNDGEVIHNFDGDANYDKGVGFSNVPHIEGSDENVGDFISRNYSTAADNAAANAILKETVEGGNELAAEQALFNPYTDLSGNDELGDALLKKGIGEENITGQTGGKFSDVSVTTDETGGRSIQCSYTSSDGKVSSYEILDNTAASNIGAYQQARDAVTHRMSSIETKATGQKIYKRSYDVKTETVSSSGDAGPSVHGGDRTVRSEVKTRTEFGTRIPNQPRSGGTPVSAARKQATTGFNGKNTGVGRKDGKSSSSMRERETKATGQKIFKRDIDVEREDS